MAPLGMRTREVSRTRLEGDEYDEVVLRLEHQRARRKKLRFPLALPVFDGNVIKWRNSTKALLHVGDVRADADFEIAMGERNEQDRMELVLREPRDTAVRQVSAAIADAIRSWFHDAETEVDPLAIQASVDKWFASGAEWRTLKRSPIAREDQHRGVLLSLDPGDSSHSTRVLSRVFSPQLHGRLDLNSTSVGNGINESFRLAAGAQCEGKQLIPGKAGVPFSRVLQKHALGLGMLARRAYLLRPIYEAAIELTEPELPLVTRYEPDEETPLHGLNLVTAVMHLDVYTHEDGIAVSQSAADRMTGDREITQLVESNLAVEPLVGEGDEVSPNTVIALDGDKHVIASKLYYPGVVAEVSQSRANRLGEPTNRAWFRFRSYYPLNTGDKLSNRHGGKGVVTVLPDKEMPQYFDGENYVAVDCCIGPETITNRKAMSILWEMMLARKATAEGAPIKVDLMDGNDWCRDELHDFRALAQEWGDKQQLILHGEDLEEPTFVAPLFWLRLDKLAIEIVTAVARHSGRNNLGGVIDQASVSGQRCNAAKLMALQSRGMTNTALTIVEGNMSAQEHFRGLVRAIQNYDYAEMPDLTPDQDTDPWG